MPAPLDGFLLAAGLGTRMGALSLCLPKPAWTLQGRPLLQWGAAALRAGGVRTLGCNAHLLPERLRAVAEGIEVFEEPNLLGSAGGLLHARGRVAGELLTWNPDIWADAVPFDPLRARHREARATLSWLLVPHPGGDWNPVWMDAQDRVLPKGVARPLPPSPTPTRCGSRSGEIRCGSDSRSLPKTAEQRHGFLPVMDSDGR
ncbi:MAG: NTP transferase domain-containing protein [Geothrix sp.]|nr:NTP transferase domain-containing protein [Geothrix sp.]